MEKKAKKRIIILVCVLAFLAAAGYFAYRTTVDYVGTKAMDMLITNQLEGMLESGEITIEDLEEILLEPEEEAAENEEAPIEGVPSSSATEPSKEKPETPKDTEKTSEEKSEAPKATEKPSEEKPETPKAPETPSEEKPEAPKTEEKPKTREETVKAASQKITETVTYDEKAAMMKLISSRLTKADIQYLTRLAAGGLDSKEIASAYYLAKARFSADEIVEVKRYWHRYKSSVIKKKTAKTGTK